MHLVLLVLISIAILSASTLLASHALTLQDVCTYEAGVSTALHTDGHVVLEALHLVPLVIAYEVLSTCAISSGHLVIELLSSSYAEIALLDDDI